MVDQEIICEERGAAGFVVLNRPHALNALTLGMVRTLAAALDRWEHAPGISRVVITAAGSRAFCAGGDIRLLHDLGRRGDHEAQLAFWREEYTLNRRIKRYAKPIIALIDGIVMGGGVGISVHARHRVAGEGFRFAMPEVSIGFFPDVGATYFLPRLPGKLGAYLALTGARIGAGDAIECGIATEFVSSRDMAGLAEALCQPKAPDRIIAEHEAPRPRAALAGERTWIDHCFAGATTEEILGRLDALGSITRAREASEAIRANAPLSVAIALRQMQIGASLDFEEAMRTEFRIVSRLCRGHDFYEGVRAAIIEKDNRPRWSPSCLAEVDPAAVAAHFAGLGADELQFAGGAAVKASP